MIAYVIRGAWRHPWLLLGSAVLAACGVFFVLAAAVTADEESNRDHAYSMGGPHGYDASDYA